MLTKIRQQAWITGLPDSAKEGGTPLEVLPLATPKLELRSLNLTLYAYKELIAQLQLLSQKQTIIPTLSLVVRTDPVKQLDDQFLMTQVRIGSILPLKDLSGAQVNFLFNSISARMGISLNPGPPTDCPAIQPTGLNMGWIFTQPAAGPREGTPIEVLNFIPPRYNRQLAVTLNKLSDVQPLVERPEPTRELSLVLPDRDTQRYIEFKLWDAEATFSPEEQKIVFKSDVIVCLTGNH